MSFSTIYTESWALRAELKNSLISSTILLTHQHVFERFTKIQVVTFDDSPLNAILQTPMIGTGESQLPVNGVTNLSFLMYLFTRERMERDAVDDLICFGCRVVSELLTRMVCVRLEECLCTCIW